MTQASLSPPALCPPLSLSPPPRLPPSLSLLPHSLSLLPPPPSLLSPPHSLLPHPTMAAALAVPSCQPVTSILTDPSSSTRPAASFTQPAASSTQPAASSTMAAALGVPSCQPVASTLTASSSSSTRLAASSTQSAAASTQSTASSMPQQGCGVPGLDRVDSLAECLVELRNHPSLAPTNQQVSNIVALWQNLLDYDKRRVVFSPRHKSRLDTRLCAIHMSTKKKGTGTVSRWDLILEDYRKIRRCILGNATVMQQTTIQLVDVSHTTLVQWHNSRDCTCPGTGEGVSGKPTAETWPWFVLMDEVLGQRHCTNPSVVIASICEDTPGPRRSQGHQQHQREGSETKGN
ncbi:unnamed protein product [Leuciscus chuanchicus]